MNSKIYKVISSFPFLGNLWKYKEFTRLTADRGIVRVWKLKTSIFSLNIP